MGHCQLDRKLGRDIDVGQTSNTISAEQAARTLALPDDAGIHHCAIFDGLKRVHLDIAVEHSAATNEHRVAQYHAFVDTNV